MSLQILSRFGEESHGFQSPRQKTKRVQRLTAAFVISASVRKALKGNGLSVTESETYRPGRFSFTKCWSGCRGCQVKQDDGLNTIHVCNMDGLLVQGHPLAGGGSKGSCPSSAVTGPSYPRGQGSGPAHGETAGWSPGVFHDHEATNILPLH